MTNSTTLRSALNGGILLLGSIAVLLALAIFTAASAHAATISTYLSVGSTGSDVTTLQTYLTANPALYPAGLITGYFGTLTEGGVQKFQVREGIVSSGTVATTGYGRVGPVTMARLNVLMGGTANNISWDTVPVMSTPTVQYTTTTATFAWVTNENTQGQVYWSTSPIQSDEATGPNQMPYISGTLALDAGGVQTNHSVTVSNLQTNTTYYYVVRSIDSSGNITMTRLQSFHTSF